MASSNDVVTTLFKKNQGYANTNTTAQVYQEKILSEPFAKASRIATQAIPSTEPTDLSATTSVAGGQKQTSVAYPYIAKYSNIPLTGIIDNPERAFYQPSRNLLLNAILPAGTNFLVSVTNNAGTLVINGANYILDRDAGTLTYFPGAEILLTQAEPPKITFWRYEGTFLSDSGLSGVSLTGISPYVDTNDNKISVNSTWKTASPETKDNWTCIAFSYDEKYRTATSYSYDDSVTNPAYVSGGYLYVSNDSGITYTKSMTFYGTDGGLLSNYNSTLRAWQGVTMSQSGRIQFAFTINNIFFMSYDYGNTWYQRNLTFNNATRARMSEDGKYILIISSDNAPIVYSKDYGTTFVSSNNSRYWTGIAMSWDGSVQYACARTTSTSQGFTLANTTYAAYASDFQPGGSAWTAHLEKIYSEFIYKSIDYGVTWTRLYTNGSYSVTRQDHGFSSGFLRFTYTSTDINPYANKWNFISTNRSGSVILAGNTQQLFVSNNSGATWNSNLNTFPTPYNDSSDFIQGDMSFDNMYMVAAKANPSLSPSPIYISTDKGATWTKSFSAASVSSWNAIDKNFIYDIKMNVKGTRIYSLSRGSQSLTNNINVIIETDVSTTATSNYVIKKDIAYDLFADNPLQGQLYLQGTSAQNRLILGSHFTGGITAAGIIQASDYFSSLDHGAPLNLNPLGGNVGINCNAPKAQLDVNGDVRINGFLQASDSSYDAEFGKAMYINPLGGTIVLGASGTSNNPAYYRPNTTDYNWNNSTLQKTSGILVSIPTGYLNNQSNGIYFNKGTIFADGGTFGIVSGTNVRRDIGLYVNRHVWSESGFVASSDQRIKTNIRSTDNEEALNDLRAIQPVLYNYKDPFERGTDEVYGFLAQQVSSVFDYGVTFQKSVVPDYFSTCAVDIQSENSTTYVTFKDIPSTFLQSLSTSQCVKFIDGSYTPYVIHVSSISADDNKFTAITPYEIKDLSGSVFLYGSEVNDFQVLDKNALFTLNFAATKDIDTIQQTHASRISVLEAQVSTLQAQVSQLIAGRS